MAGHKVTVVGGGVSGLTAAVALRQAGYEADIVSDRNAEDLVSWLAAAIWTVPDLTGRPPRTDWAIRTREVFTELAERPGVGVRPLRIIELVRDDPGQVWWETTPWVDRIEPPVGYAVALSIAGFLVDPPQYLPWLKAELESLGGTISRRHIRSLSDLDGDVVNATGLRAADLTGDTGLYPIRGQVVAVEAPAVTGGVSDENDPGRVTYVYPRPREVIVGGTRQIGVQDLTVDPGETDRILADARRLEPSLVGSEIIDVRVGLRPGRDEPRVEVEHDGGRRIIHDYGHSGNGYLLSWGCAEEVVRLIGS